MLGVNFQNVLFNVRDADTFEIIDEDFTVMLYPIDESTYRTIKCGTSILSNIPVKDGFVTIVFPNEGQVSALRYDPGSLTGNYIVFEGYYDEASGITTKYMPWEVNLFIKKLS
ncbi:hypothetical protein [Dysgonomonas sp. HGC4]|uniref:hypothetical protein n=1 Tax=Dysgonomonas sp. HGC4 TaxID=1658009 RepID=UPI0006822582|nr:hypothetical protein [Dysgonomonas sp. HGC4]MBD8347015.1 hypothetical protein [Dysgonomonas sp. HGC4]